MTEIPVETAVRDPEAPRAVLVIFTPGNRHELNFPAYENAEWLANELHDRVIKPNPQMDQDQRLATIFAHEDPFTGKVTALRLRDVTGYEIHRL